MLLPTYNQIITARKEPTTPSALYRPMVSTTARSCRATSQKTDPIAAAVKALSNAHAPVGGVDKAA